MTLPPPNSEQEKILSQLRALPRPRIGVSWESFALTANFRERKSIPAAEFAVLTQSLNATFINLQFPNPNQHEQASVQHVPTNVMTLPNVDLKNDIQGSYLICLTANIGGKATIAVAVDDNSTLDAGKIIKEHIAPLIKGGGGGNKTLATAGGQDASQLANVIETVKGLA